MCFQYVHEFRSIFWIMSNLSGATSLKKTDYHLLATINCYWLLSNGVNVKLLTTSPLHAGILFGLVLCKFFVCYHNGCEFMCAIKLQRTENIVSLQTSTTSSFWSLSTSLLWLFLSLGRREYDIDTPFRAEPVSSLCVNYL